MDTNKLTKEAVFVVDMFDQANTFNVIRDMGKRGELLEYAVNKLRALLNEDEQRTMLTEEQAR